ncbi:hypothetical protein NMY22_g15097 [Coprinellus aureogranulatus]|nr:hypothetical protein NMY22_g15097 [Coprinellus aureogranulatus]
MDTDYYADHDLIRYLPETQRARLQSAVLLSEHSVPSIVWDADAIAFAHEASVTLWYDVQLLVPDPLVQHASKIIQDSLPYILNPEPLPRYREIDVFHDEDRLTCFPYSNRLSLTRSSAEETWSEWNPRDILIHPASFFQFDIADTTRSLCLEWFPENVCFPTKPALLDSIVATILDPPLGYYHETLRNHMEILKEDLIRETMRGDDPNDMTCDFALSPEGRRVVDSLKEENKKWIERSCGGERRPTFWSYVRERRELIAASGSERNNRRALELKPFPLPKRPGSRGCVELDYLENLPPGCVQHYILHFSADICVPLQSASRKAVHVPSHRNSSQEVSANEKLFDKRCNTNMPLLRPPGANPENVAFVAKIVAAHSWAALRDDNPFSASTSLPRKRQERVPDDQRTQERRESKISR